MSSHSIKDYSTNPFPFSRCYGFHLLLVYRKICLMFVKSAKYSVVWSPGTLGIKDYVHLWVLASGPPKMSYQSLHSP